MLIWTGTATVTNGDATVVVDTGAALTAEVVFHGAIVALDGIVYFADSLTDTTTLELTRVYSGSTGTVDMEVWPVSQDTTNLVNLAQIVARTQAQINILDKNSQGLFFNMKGVTGAADPGPGFIAFDDEDPTLVTEAYIDALDANGRAVSELVALWEAGTVIVARSLTTTAYRAYEVVTNTDESGWRTLVLTYVGHDGVLADNEALGISWSRVGEGLEIDAVGTFAGRSTYDGAAAGFVYLSTNGNGSSNTTPSIYRKASATSGDWSAQFPFQGPQGDRGWSPVFAVVSDGVRRVLRLVDYVGGAGTKPTTGINQYVSSGGLTSTIGSATDIRGSQGATNGIRMSMHNAVSTDAPNAGWFRTNNSSFGSITELRFGLTPVDSYSASISGWVQALDDVINAESRGTLRFQSEDDISVYMEFAITGALTTEATYQALPVSPIAGDRPGANTVFYASFVPAGSDGTDGVDGADGTDPGALFNWDDGTADEDPGAGNMRADNSDLSAAEFLYVSKEGRTGADLETFLLGFGTSTNTIKGHVTLTNSAETAQAIIRVISLTDATNYVKVGLQAATHAGATSFTDAEPISLQFSLAGNQGAADEVSMASAINGSPEVTEPSSAAKVAITDPDNSDQLSWISVENLQTAINPRPAVEAKSASYTVVEADNGAVLSVDAGAAARTITLLPAADAGEGFKLIVKKIDSSANIVTIDGNASETIDGATVKYLSAQYQTIQLICDGTGWHVIDERAAATPGQLFGLTLANDTTYTTDGILISSGQASSDASPADLIVLPSAITKRIGFSWSTALGGLDSGSVAANKWYHVWLIKRASDGAVNALFSLSATNPTMPSGWTGKRRIGTVLTDGSSNIRAFVQAGSYFGLVTPFSVASGANDGNVLRTVVATTGIKLRLSLASYFTSAANTAFFAMKDADEGIATTSDFQGYTAAAGHNGAARGHVFCNASGQVYTYSNRSDSTLTNMYLQGWSDQRGAQHADF